MSPPHGGRVASSWFPVEAVGLLRESRYHMRMEFPRKTPYGRQDGRQYQQSYRQTGVYSQGYGQDYAAGSQSYGGYGANPQAYGPQGNGAPVQDGSLILNRYRPLGKAGEGGFGTVQLAWDTRIHRRVAVKSMQIPASLQMGYQDSNVFDELSPSQIPGLEEARTAAMLTHPNIVQVYDFEVQGGIAYLIMEYVDGMTLQELLRTVGDDMTLDMVTAVFDGVAHALEFAHENQVLHLDIKPANILIDRQGQVKVTDFGLARLSDIWGYSAANGGTIGYMPPEQMRQEPLDARCDEWALASVLYEMISGRNPFAARSIPDAIQVIENAEIVLPSLCMEGLPDQADDVIFYALDPDRNERYSSVRDFDDELAHYLGDEAMGRRQIQSALASYLVDDGSQPDQTSSMWTAGFSALKPKFERLGGKVTTVSLRIWALLTSMAAAVAELPTFDVLGGWTTVQCKVAFVAMLAVAFFFPKAGALVSLLLLAVTLLMHGVYVPALLIAALALAWWLSIGGKGNAEADCGTLPFAAGAVGLNQISPLLCGFFLPSGSAMKSAVFNWILAVFLAAFGGVSLLGWNVSLGTFAHGALEKNLVALLSDATTYIVLASWVIAACVTSMLVGRGTRGTAVGGAAAGGGVLIAGAMVVTGFSSGFASWAPNVNYMVPAIIAMLLVGILGWVYEPDRPDANKAA